MERRRWERFTLDLRARVTVLGRGTTEELMLKTQDVCPGGVALKTNHPLPVGTEVDVEVDLFSGQFRRFKDSIMKGSGRVVRTVEREMAISFDEPAEIVMVKGVGPEPF